MGALRSLAWGTFMSGIMLAGSALSAELTAEKTGPKTLVDLTYVSPLLNQKSNDIDGGVFEPYMRLDWQQGVYFTVWGQFQTGDNGGATNDGEFSEIDFTLGYKVPLPDSQYKLSVSVSEYLYPGTGNEENDEESDREALMTLSTSFPLNPMLRTYYRLNGKKKNQMKAEARLTQSVWEQGKFKSSVRGSLYYLQRTPEQEKESELKSGVPYTRLSAVATYGKLSTSINYLFETDAAVYDLPERQNVYFTVGSSTVL